MAIDTVLKKKKKLFYLSLLKTAAFLIISILDCFSLEGFFESFVTTSGSGS